jgi:phage shock protein PspC (stress-responsive transcriptional regulator)
MRKIQLQQTNKNQTTNTTMADARRRMFRDPDAKIAGGVCAGFANYFDIDPLWIRISLVILVFMSVGILIPLYIILWVIIPEARTTAEKLEMHGEPIDINNISKTVKEEAGQFKDRMQNMGDRMKNARTGDKVADALKQIFGTIFQNHLQNLRYVP